MLRVGSEAPDFPVPLIPEKRSVYPTITEEKTFSSISIQRISPLDVQSRRAPSPNISVMIGISSDSIETHRKFAAAHSLQFPMGADEGRSIMKQHEALQLGIRPLRITFVIGKAGVVRGAAHHEFLIDTHWQSVITVLDEVKAKE